MKQKKINDDTITYFTKKANKGYEHLLTYFTTLKNKQINHLISLINSIESAYEECIKRNKKKLSLLEKLINSYDGSVDMKKKIERNIISIYQCANDSELIKFFKNYSIIEKKQIEEAKCITDHTSSVFFSSSSQR